MKEGNQHIIHKVMAELTLPETDRHPEMWARLEESVTHALQNLEPVLDKASGQTLCRIDTLSVEISVSKSMLNQLDEHLEHAILEKVVDSVKKIRGQDYDKNQMMDSARLTEDEQFREIVSTFLMTGHLPWWVKPAEFRGAGKWLSSLSESDWILFAKSVFQNQPLASRRLVAQFPEPVIRELLQKSVSIAFGNDQILRLKKQILHFFSNRKNTEHFHSELNERMIRKIVSGIDVEILIDDMLELSMNSIMDMNRKASQKANLIHFFKKYVEGAGLSNSGNRIDKALKRFEVSTNDTQSRFSKKDPVNQSSEEKRKKEKQGLQVSTAGLVLLHPFLESFFKNLGFIDGGRFVNDAAKERAICLMHHLATGDEEFPEYELTMPKFLCGRDFELPVNRYISFTESEKDESENLLLSCLKHWEALKNTSVEALRENFIRRAGILRKEEFGWSLFVEKETHDILLEKLPWNLSVVKLKWMDEMLTIYWH